MSGEPRVLVAAASVPGCSHVIHGGSPCQDASGTYQQDGLFVLAVADGHGDPKHPRSAEGARIAVEVALTLLRDALDQRSEGRADPGIYQLEGELRKHLPHRISYEWNRRAKLHAQMMRHIASGSESADWENDSGAWDHILKDYGTTLLAAGFDRDVGVFIQIGDGDIVAFGVDGKSFCIFPPQDKTFGPATLSLASAGSSGRMQLHCLDLRREPLSFLALCTDGLSDLYEQGELEAWWRRLLERITVDGWVQAINSLTEMLCRLSQSNGDDASAAVALWEPSERRIAPRAVEAHGKSVDPLFAD